MSTPQQLPVVLRTAAVWGTTVLAVRNLNSEQSLQLSDGEIRRPAQGQQQVVAEQRRIDGHANGAVRDDRGCTGD